MGSEDQNQIQCALPNSGFSAEPGRMSEHEIDRGPLPMTWVEQVELATKSLARIGIFMTGIAGVAGIILALLHYGGMQPVPP
jgi:hypothetical protein